MACRIEAIPTTLSHLQGHSLLQAIGAAVYKILTDTGRRALTVRWWSFLLSPGILSIVSCH